MSDDPRIEFLELLVKKLSKRVDRLEGMLHALQRESRIGPYARLPSAHPREQQSAQS